MTEDSRLPFQKLDIYVVAKALAKKVHDANIQDPEQRDQATRAAKSAFNNTCEGLPSYSAPMRRKFFNTARGSLWETLGAVDLAADIGAVAREDAAEIQRLGVRMHQMLTRLLR
jgi:four helix bundle protein